MGVAATLFAVQQLKRIEQRRSGAAQWLLGPRSIGQNEFPFRTIKSIIIIIINNAIEQSNPVVSSENSSKTLQKGLCLLHL